MIDEILDFVAAIVNLRFCMYFGISQFAFHIQNVGTENAVIPRKITETKILPVKLGQLATGSRKRPGKILFYLLFADKINVVCLINS